MSKFIDRLPEVYKKGESGELLSVIETHRSETEKRIEQLSTYMDPDTCPPEQLDVMLKLVGWTVALEFTERQKRKLVKIVTTIHRQSGTTKGIVSAIRYLLGAQPEVIEYLRERYETDGTVYPAEEDEMNYTFALQFPITNYGLDDMAAIKKIVEFMKPPNAYYRPILKGEIQHTIDVYQSVILFLRKNFLNLPQSEKKISVFMHKTLDANTYQAPLLLDGSWKLNGTYTLKGYINRDERNVKVLLIKNGIETEL